MTRDAHMRSTVAGSGDAAMFTELLRRCDPQMRKLAYGMVRNREASDDALQLAYLKAFRNFDSFQQRSSFSTWLYTIVYRTCLDEIRRRRPDESIDSLDINPDTSLDVGDRVGMSMLIDDALKRLPVDQRDAVLLFDGHGLSFEEASRTLGIPPGTLGSRLSRARTALRSSLQAEDRFEDHQ